LWWRLSEKTTVDCFQVGVFLPINDGERALLFGKVGEALATIRTHAPVRYGQLARDVPIISVLGRPKTAAQYVAALHMCDLYVGWVRQSEVSAALVAAAIVHEGQHARLNRLGFPYATSHEQTRIERICHRAERVFARRLPDNDNLVAQATTGMQAPERFYRRSQRLRRTRLALDELAAENPIVGPLAAWYKARVLKRLRGERQRRGRRTTGCT
jgi:hypothetical protein